MIEAIQDFLIQVTLFDYIFFVLTIYFLIQGSRKGFVLSLLSAAKWVLAYILTIYLFPKVKPYFDGILDSEYVLDITVGVILFILIIFLILLGNKAIVILGGIPNSENRKLLFVVSLGDDAVKIGLHAGKLINEIARICSGGGGGKPNFAQAGAKDIDKLSGALDYAKNYLKKTLESYSDK